MEIEKLNLYRDTNWNDIKLRFCGHSECLPLHSYGPGTRPYYLMHFVLSGKGRLVVNKTDIRLQKINSFWSNQIRWSSIRPIRKTPGHIRGSVSMVNLHHISCIVLDSVTPHLPRNFLQKSLKRLKISSIF